MCYSMNGLCKKYIAMSNENVRLSLHLSQERKKLRLSQQEIADKCGVTRQTWGLYERALATPTGEVLLKFQEAGADIAYIFSKEDSYKAKSDLAPYGNNAINILQKAYDDTDEIGKQALMSIAKLILDKCK